MTDIYKYYNYRKYLKDFFSDKKNKSSGISHRYVLKKMEITSTGFLANVISGKQNLTIKQSKKISEVLGLSADKAKYLKYMVYFERTKTIDEKNDHFETLNDLRRSKLKKLSKSQLHLFANWYNVVILELLHIYDFKDDYKALAELVEPNIKIMHAKNAVRELEALGLIKKNKKGFYKQVSRFRTTGDDLHSFLVNKYQREMIDMEKSALERFSLEKRDISGLTVSLSENDFTKVKEEIRDFRKRILNIVESGKDPNGVYRCNFKIFPMSKKVDEK